MKLLSLATFVTAATALGINCRGSSNCNFQDGMPRLQQVQDKVGQLISRGQGGRFYNTGEQIACAAHICAFYQNGATGTANDAFNQLQTLLDHGCTACGSVPTQPGNNVATGELTVNYASSTCCSSGAVRCYCP